jgi:transposase
MNTIQMKKTDQVKNLGSADGGPEGALRATGGAPSVGGSERTEFLPPNPEVSAQQPRRKFTAHYKLRVLKEAESCNEPGQIGQLLRREGLYFSNLTTWRRQLDQGLLNVMSPKKRGRKNQKINPLAQRVAQLEKENRRLEQRLKQAEIIIDAQKKISEILGIRQDNLDLEGSR